jgi:hypothetical protein
LDPRRRRSGHRRLAIVGRRRRNHNQLGFALQLCALRYPGRLLRPGEVIPQPALHFVADQLGTAPEALITYAARFQTRYEQLGVLRTAFGFADLTPRRRQLLEWLLPVSLATTNPLTVATTLLDELRRSRIIVPGPSIVERLVAATLATAERHVANQLTGGLTQAQSEALEALLAPKPDTAMSMLAWARLPPGAHGAQTRRRTAGLPARAWPRSHMCGRRSCRTAAQAGPRGRPLHRPASARAVFAASPRHPRRHGPGDDRTPDR